MGIALSAVHGLFTPFQDLLAWLVSPIQPAVAPATATRAVQRCPAASRQAARPLRVVRVMDRDGNRARAGSRMVISGRMADVCAELDRLAALEQVRH